MLNKHWGFFRLCVFESGRTHRTSCSAGTGLLRCPRNVQAHLRGEAPPFSASDITQLMAVAGEVSRDLGSAERDVERYWVAEYMRQRWQRQQQQLRRQRLQQQQEPAGLPAMVLGWVRPELNLAAVTLEELGLENVIKVRVCGVLTCCEGLPLTCGLQGIKG